MKFRKLGQFFLASVVSLGLVTGFTACTGRTIDYVYVTSSGVTPGQINAYEVDSKSGAIHLLNGSPITTKYTNPVAVVVSPDAKFLYVAFKDSNIIQQFAIAGDGKLTEGKTYSTPGTSPVSIAINTAGTYLYVVDTYAPGYTDLTTAPGALVAYPITTTDGTLGTPVANGKFSYYEVGRTPTSVNVLYNNNAVFVTNRDDATLSAFAVGTGGALTALGAGNAGAGKAGVYNAGVSPVSVVSDIRSTYVYVADYKQNQILGYAVQGGTSLVPLPSSPYKTGNQPINLMVEPRNKYLYAVNYVGASLSGYQIDAVTGALTALSGGLGAAETDSLPTCVFIEPSLARFVYTTNSLANSVSSFRLDPNAGTLTATQGSPVKAAANPTCGVAIPHGNHAVQHVDGVGN